MKRFLGLLCLLLCVNACDDGDMKVETINFDEISPLKCSLKDVFYKVRGNEMLFLELPITDLKNEETLEGDPRIVEISSTKRLVYRIFSGETSLDNICPQVPVATPNVIEEWITTAGTIEITTTAIKTTDATTNATKITSYKHYIVLKNVTFEKPSGTLIMPSFVFGNYNTTATNLPFGFDEEDAAKSTCNSKILNINGGEVLILDVDNFSTLFANEVTTTSRKFPISATKKVSYQLYNATISNAFFCAATVPSTPVLLQEWIAIDGIDTVEGIIEVTTVETNDPDIFRHTINLKKVTVKRGNSDFYLGDDFLFGTFETGL